MLFTYSIIPEEIERDLARVLKKNVGWERLEDKQNNTSKFWESGTK